ncbi:MAG: hypothetical protein H0T46_24265 [Deltaproteobacteria bacterium]|nr:hypothetical protein [Deltaproteobacteria bacterium]
MTSLAELRAIEEERVAAERAQVIAEADGKQRATEAAAARIKADAEAKLAAERAEQIRIAKEREDAERAARMHVEAAEAMERARLAAALEAERTAQELDLKRQEVAKKRPTWMIAVTMGAVLAAGALTWFGIDRYNEAEISRKNEEAANEAKRQAEHEMEESRARLVAMETDLAALDKRVGTAIDQVVAATSAAERKAAKDNLDRLRREEQELRRKQQEEKDRLAKIKRKEKVIISEECKRNSLAKGCM